MPAPEQQRTFLIECYAPDIALSDVEAVGRRAATAAAQLRDEGHSIEYVRALLVPGDDAVFHVFSADAIDTVREAGERAAIQFERVVESVAVELEPGSGSSGATHAKPAGGGLMSGSAAINRDVEM